MLSPVLGIPFYLAIACYVASAALALTSVRPGVGDNILSAARRTAAAGNILLLAVVLMRWVQHGRVPLTGLGDSLNLFLILCTGIMLTVQRRPEMRPLLVYYLPALAALAIFAGAVGHRYLGVAPEPLNALLLIVHVGLVFAAFALFFVAAITAFAYANKAQSLKRRSAFGFIQRLPSLEHLDRALFRLVGLGYPIFVITLVLGFLWVWARREEHGQLWYVSPRILLAAAMVAFYAASYHGRKFGVLRGPKLAYFVFFGFVALLVAYLGMSVLDVESYRFGSGAG